MSCKDRHDVLSAYVDGEATDAEREEFSTHLKSCADCMERVVSLRSLKHGVSRLDAVARPPEAVLARVDALRFGQKERQSRFVLSRRWGILAAAAVVTATLIAITLGSSWFGGGDAPSLSDELIADHLKYVPEAMPAEVASSDPEDVRRFFEGKVPFDPAVPSLEGANLIGGRLCRIRGYYEQLLFYERDGRKLSLYVSNRPDTSSECEGRGGYHVCGQRRAGLSLMLVGDAPRSELRTLLNGAGL